MSRVQFKGKVFDVAVGVDHLTGTFLQIWKKPWSEQDGCFLKIEGRHMSLTEDVESLEKIPAKAMDLIALCAQRMALGEGRYLGEATITNIVLLLDEYVGDTAEEIRTKIYQALD